jgi:hypothetical protein
MTTVVLDVARLSMPDEQLEPTEPCPVSIAHQWAEADDPRLRC